jgi:cytochrome c551/c552
MPANDQYWRDLPTMHKVFAGSAFALFAATLLMMARDEKREWRDYQRQAEKLKVAKITGQLSAVDTADLKTQVEGIEKKITEIFSGETAQKAREAEAQVKQLKGDLDRLATESKFKNAERDVARANFDIAVRDAIPDAELAKVRAKYDAEQLQAEAKVKIVEGARAKYDAAKAELVGITKARDDEQAQLDKLTAARKALVEQIELLEPSTKWIAAKRSFKEWPIINGFNPHLKIQYDWPKGLKQQLGMANVDRVDRCRSCHVNINDFGAGNVAAYPAGDGHGGTYHQPFSAHPNPDLFLTATSPHPIDKFGCTICHEGDGSGTSFQNAEHAPTNPAQAAEWEEKHHWHSNHFWELPMFPKHLAEATCIRCHHDVTSLAASDKFGNSAPKVVEGHSIISKYGCFGCHEINGYDGAKPIGPDLRLEPNTPEQAAKIASDPNAVAGGMRKVGPSLRHIAQKSTPEFVAYWTENPTRFRPTTRMPKFFGNSNQQDHLAEMLQPVELQAVAAYLDAKSQPLELLTPKDGYQANAERGKNLFSRRGCMACHSYGDEELQGMKADFGPDLTKIHEKIKPGVDGFKWMYTWLKEPNRYHTRTKMPNLYLNPEGEGDKYIDPAADIAAFLLAKGPTEFPKFQTAVSVLGVVCDDNFTEEEAKALGVEHSGVRITEVLPGSAATRLEPSENNPHTALQVDDIITKVGSASVRSVESLNGDIAKLPSGEPITLTYVREGHTLTAQLKVSTPLDDLVRLYLKKALGSTEKVNAAMAAKQFPVDAKAFDADKDGKVEPLTNFVKGDEIELAHSQKDGKFSPEEWERQKLIYIGRKTVSRYGCYGCHDIPGFEDAGPIGMALQDWGRKDTSKLAPEHIEEYLHHHGEVDGSSTLTRVEDAINRQKNDGNANPADLSAAFFVDSLVHHGRPGFVWQKLRDPRSYDYKKIETKGWDERLRMPKFPFTEQQIESVATFVVGLVADPPAPAYQFKPTGAKAARLEGERLLSKYNCGGCHILEMPEFQFAISPDDLSPPGLGTKNFASALPLLNKINPVRVLDPEKLAKTKSGDLMLAIHGLVKAEPDPEEALEDQILVVNNWDHLQIGDKTYFPGDSITIPAAKVQSRTMGRGGDLAHWLAPQLKANETAGDNDRAWQASPPPLVREGQKVQTPWLYQFLKEPHQIRHTTVLRMPKFNIDDKEALALANYFAAVDNAEFPYQENTRQNPDYLAAAEAAHAKAFAGVPHDRLTAGWKLVTTGQCTKCHQVGGLQYVSLDPSKDIRGPNLDQVEKRLRPDWVQLWVTNPKWVTPYTSMPQVYAADASIMPEYIGGQPAGQIDATVDALLNYLKLLERHGKAPPPPATPAPAPAQ